jgi:hypothetical protein
MLVAIPTGSAFADEHNGKARLSPRILRTDDFVKSGSPDNTNAFGRTV